MEDIIVEKELYNINKMRNYFVTPHPTILYTTTQLCKDIELEGKNVYQIKKRQALHTLIHSNSQRPFNKQYLLMCCIFLIMMQLQKAIAPCTDDYFPKIIGSLDEETTINQIDYSSTGQVLIAVGYTKSANLHGLLYTLGYSPMFPLISFYLGNPLKLQEAKVIDQQDTQATAVAMNQGGNYIAVMIQGYVPQLYSSSYLLIMQRNTDLDMRKFYEFGKNRMDYTKGRFIEIRYVDAGTAFSVIFISQFVETNPNNVPYQLNYIKTNAAGLVTSSFQKTSRTFGVQRNFGGLLYLEDNKYILVGSIVNQANFQLSLIQDQLGTELWSLQWTSYDGAIIHDYSNTLSMATIFQTETGRQTVLVGAIGQNNVIFLGHFQYETLDLPDLTYVINNGYKIEISDSTKKIQGLYFSTPTLAYALISIYDSGFKPTLFSFDFTSAGYTYIQVLPRVAQMDLLLVSFDTEARIFYPVSSNEYSLNILMTTEPYYLKTFSFILSSNQIETCQRLQDSSIFEQNGMMQIQNVTSEFSILYSQNFQFGADGTLIFPEAFLNFASLDTKKMFTRKFVCTNDQDSFSTRTDPSFTSNQFVQAGSKRDLNVAFLKTLKIDSCNELDNNIVGYELVSSSGIDLEISMNINGMLTVYDTLPEGSHSVTIKATLLDGQRIQQNVDIYCRSSNPAEPFFLDQFSTRIIGFGLSLDVLFPVALDPQNIGPITIKCCTIQTGAQIPSDLGTYSSLTNTLTIKATNPYYNSKTFTISTFIINGNDIKSQTYTFDLQISGTAPFFNLQQPFTDIILAHNKQMDISLPSISASDLQAVSVFVRFDGIDSANGKVPVNWGSYHSNIITLKSEIFDIGMVHTVQVALADSGGQSDYQFSVTFTNTAPKFSTNPTTTFKSYCEVKTSTGLPSIIDAEGDPAIVTIFPPNGLPNYMQISNDNHYFVIDASSITIPDPNTYTFSLIVRDGYLETRYDNLQAKVLAPVPQFKEDIPLTILAGLDQIKSFVVPDYFSPVLGRGVNLNIFQDSSSVQYEFFHPIYYDSAKKTFDFSPAMALEVGNEHTLEFKLIDDIGLTSTYILKIDIVDPIDPYIDQANLPLKSQYMQLNDNPRYEVPVIIDPRGGTITLELIPSVSFATILQNPFEILFSPCDFSDVGIQNVQLKASTNSGGYSYYPLEITVTNTPPQLQSFLTDPLTLSLGKVAFQYLNLLDQEGNQIFVKLGLSTEPEKQSLLEEFTTIIDIDNTKQQIVFQPTLFTQKGLYNVIINLSDGQLKNDLDYTFQLIVENTPPFFISSPADTEVHYKMHQLVSLPKIIDKDGHEFSVSHTSLPPFISFDSSNIEYSVFPDRAEYLITQEFAIVGLLNDGYEENTFAFKITVINDPPFWVNTVRDQVVRVGQELTYSLPDVIDYEGMQTSYEIVPDETTQYPTFARLFGNYLVMNPTDESQIGDYKIRINIVDSEGAYGNSQTLKITVISQYAGTTSDFGSLLLNSGPPTFNSSYTSYFVVVQGIESFLQLPHIYDPDHDPYIVSLGNGEWLSFTKLLKTNEAYYSLQFFPNKENSQPRTTYIVSLIIEDRPLSKAKSKKSQYPIQLTVLPQYNIKPNSNISDEQGHYEGTGSTNKVKKIIKAQLKIQQITNDQRLKLKISAPVLKEELIDHLHEGQLKLMVTYPYQQSIKIQIEERDRVNGKLIVKMDMNDELIAEQQNSKEDYLVEIRVTEKVEVQSAEFVTFIQKNLFAQQLLPPQLTEYQQNMQAGFSKSLQIVTGLVISGSIFINFFLSSFLQLLWNLMNDISFLTILSLISQSIPGIAQRIQYTMLSFIYLDVFQTDSWFPAIFFPKEDPDDDEAINFYFQLNGFQSMNLIKNLGSTFIYLLALGFLYLFTFILLALAIKIKALTMPVQRLKQKIFWNPGLRFVLQQYPPLLISSLINLYALNFSSVGNAFGSVGSCFIILLSVIIQIQSFLSIRNRSQMQNQEFIEKFGTLLEGIKIDSKIGPYWNVIILGRWSLTSLILVILRNHPQFQIGMLLFLSLIIQILFVTGKPYSLKSDNYIGFFNETMVSLYLYIMLILTEFNPLEGSNIRENLGLLLSMTVLFSVLVNFTKFFVQAINVFKVAIQQRRQKNQQKSTQYQVKLKFTPFKTKLHNANFEQKSTVVEISLEKEQPDINNKIEKQGRKKIVKRKVKKGVKEQAATDIVNQHTPSKPQMKHHYPQNLHESKSIYADVEAINPIQSLDNNSIVTNKESLHNLNNQKSIDNQEKAEANFFDYIEYRKKIKEFAHIDREEVERRRKKREEFTFKNFNFDEMRFNDKVKEQ